MFQRVLIPLDGSDLSHRILTPVRRLVEEERPHLDLVRAVPETCCAEETEAARGPLEQVASTLADLGVEVTTAVLPGDPAQVIIDRIAASEPSLVAMASHGRTGPWRWIRGSVAERVLRRSPAPLLLWNPPADDPEAVPFRRILLPLDGSTRAETVVGLVERFARIYGSEVVLLRIGRPRAALLEALELAGSSGDLQESLEPVRQRLKTAGVQVRCRIDWGDEPTRILEAVQQEEADLVAMTTHGYTAIDRWVLGSIAENVLRHCHVPLLIKRTAAFATAR